MAQIDDFLPMSCSGESERNGGGSAEGSMPVFSDSSSSGEESMGPIKSSVSPENEEKNAELLNQLEGVLQKPDAVMEPDILSKLISYAKNNGDPRQAIEYMSDGYVGYAQAGSLLCKWLKFVEEDNAMGDTEQAGGYSGFPAVSRSPEYVREAKKAKLDCIGSQKESAGQFAWNEAYFLRQLVLEKFNPSKFAGIFSKGGSGAPLWLNGLIEDFDGRKLIYELSSRYQNSLLLNFAVQKILMQPGRDEEVAAQGVALSNYFSVFHRVLKVRLRSFTQTNDEKEIERLGSLIQQSASSSQLGYVHVRQVLTELVNANKPWSSRFKRLLEELEIKTSESASRKMARFFSTDDGSVFMASSFIADILATVVGGYSAPTSEVMKLHQTYRDNKSKSIKPSLMHHPVVIEALVHSIFNPRKKMYGDALIAHAELLAIAVSGLDNTEGNVLQQEGVKLMRVAILDAAEIGHKVVEDMVLVESERNRAEKAMQQICCASGALYLLRNKLVSPEYWNAVYHVHKEPPFLVLFFAIIKHQRDMQGEVFEAIQKSLQAASTSSQGMDIALGLIQVLITLCKTDLIRDVLSWAPEWAKNADTNLSRAFVFGLLDIAAPPYSRFFVENLLKVINFANIRRQSLGSRVWSTKVPILQEFYDGLCDLQPLNIGPSEASALRQLRDSLNRR